MRHNTLPMLPMAKVLKGMAVRIKDHMALRKEYLPLFLQYNTSPEEWFRAEILMALHGMSSVSIKGTNHRVDATRNRPDYWLSTRGKRRLPRRYSNRILIELKVLPKDRNYNSGWQRFQASKNNKKDFLNLQSGARQGVIYVYWPDHADWQECKKRLVEKYKVGCIYEDCLAFGHDSFYFTYWVQRPRSIRSKRL